MFSIFGKRKPKTRSAEVYQYSDFLIVHAQHQSTAGVTLAALPLIRLSTTATSGDIGHALRRIEFLEEAGFRSWQALQKSAKSCWIEEASDRITFTPTRNGGNKGKEKGFGPFGAELIVVASSCTDGELGDALVRALKVSES